MWLLATTGAILLKLIIDELLEWCPWLAERLIMRAAERLPAKSQDRYREEWLAELQAVRGKGLSKLVFAGQILFNAGRVREALGEIRLPRRQVFLVRLADISLSAVSLLAMAPLIAFIALAIRILDPGPVFVRQAQIRDGEIVRSQLFFRTFSVSEDRNGTSSELVTRESRLGQWLRRTGLDGVPGLIDVFRGSMSFVGPALYQGSELEHVKPGLWAWDSPRERADEADRAVRKPSKLEWLITWKNARHPLRALVRHIRRAFTE